MSFERVIDEYFPRGMAPGHVMEGRELSIAKSMTNEVVDQEHGLQKFVRPFFGKQGYKVNGIGAHPDYQHLSGTRNLEKGAICTLFLDIAKSSRLNVIYDLEVACNIKNRILQVAIEVIRAFDGYPHRMMGDAIMAFFGGKDTEDEQASIDAINSSTVLRYVVVHHVVPRLEEITGIQETKLGIRIGVDFGNERQVVWGAFGYNSAFEITAHGVSVDLCSKLQGMAGKNNVMLGQGVLDFVDYPSDFSSHKIDKEGNPVRYVKPNITDSSGNSINYKCRVVDFEKHFSLTPFPAELKEKVCRNIYSIPGVVLVCEWSPDSKRTWYPYLSIAAPLPKNVDLRFTVLVSNRYFDNEARYFSLNFVKVNHGVEATRAGDVGQHTPRRVRVNNQSRLVQYGGEYFRQCEVFESTRYRGIHEMRVSGSFNGKIVEGSFKNVIGVLIK